MKQKLDQMIGIKESECVNCHACITACPIKHCNDGSGDHISIDSDLCIGCGGCLAACTHNARYPVDDFDQFQQLLEGDGLASCVILVAPAIVASLPDHYLKLNSWLDELGASGIFDVSFGAELTVHSYLKHLDQFPDRTVIAAACPVIVSYIEIYQPELLKYLPKYHSPQIHTVKMIEAYYPELRDKQIVVITPCIAKKREFTESGYNIINVGFSRLIAYLQEQGIDLGSYPDRDYTSPLPGRGVTFPAPGGLVHTMRRWRPIKSVRRIEGTLEIYQYLEQLPGVIQSGDAPLMIDCLNCGRGCNGGPLTDLNTTPIDTIEARINRRREKLMAQEEDHDQLLEEIESHWKGELYRREYPDLSDKNSIKEPSEEEIEQIFYRMYKYQEQDIYNCSSCGYHSCRGMAKAIYNGKNRPENCHFYLLKETEYAHKQVTRERKRLKNILNTSLDGFIRVDNDFIIREFNPAICQMIQMEPDQLINRSLFDLVTRQSRRELARQLYLREKGVATTYEVVLKRKDGSEVICQASASPLYSGNGERTGSFAMLKDISNQKESEAALRQQEANLRTTLNAIQDGVVTTDSGGKILQMNPVAEQLVGWRIQDAGGKTIEQVVFLESSDRKPINPEGLDYSGRRGVLDAPILISRDGTRYRINYTVSPVIGGSEHSVGSVFVFQNITDSIRREEELIQAQKMETIATLSGGLAHDFNNVLSGIYAPVSMLIYQIEEGEQLEGDHFLEDLEMIRHSAARASEMVKQLLTFSHRQDFSVMPVDLNQVLKHVVRMGRSTFDKSIQIIPQYYDGEPIAKIDPGGIEQVLLNIAINAAHAMTIMRPKGSRWGGHLYLGVIPVEIDEFTMRQFPDAREGNYWRIDLRDTGVGIDQKVKEQIFTPFYTTKSRGVGTGLGLSMAYTIVKEHGGFITLYSEAGTGTTFHIYLPVARKRTQRVLKPQAARIVRGSGTILVIDDEPSIRKIARGMLERAGYRVLVAPGGYEGIEIYKRHHQQINGIILDMMMPEISGQETFMELKKIDPDVKVLLSSGFKEDQRVQEIMKLGIRGFLQKPYDFRTFTRLVYEYLSEKSDFFDDLGR